MTQKFFSATSSIERYGNINVGWGYIEDPTYARSIDSHVCITCSKFDYLSQVNCGSVLYCKFHQKLICNGQHLTHSCELYENKSSFNNNKN